jgi:cbb3-type cytochrome oxidase cytochrome c subunit
MAHLYDPRTISPWSVMPAYTWLFDEAKRPEERALAVVAYLQWLGSWLPPDGGAETMMDTIAGEGAAASPPAAGDAP